MEITGDATSVTADKWYGESLGDWWKDVPMSSDIPTTRNNPNSTMQPQMTWGLTQTAYDPAFEKRMREAEFNASQKYYDDQRMSNALTSAGNSTSYTGLGASLGSAGGAKGAAAGAAAGLALDLALQYQKAKKQKRLEEQQRMVAKKMERIENAERLRQRQMSNAEMGMLASDKELADRKFNEAQALKFRQALNNVTNQKMARLGINPYGKNGYQTSDMGGVRVDPNRAYGIMGNAGLDVVRA